MLVRRGLKGELPLVAGGASGCRTRFCRRRRRLSPATTTRSTRNCRAVAAFKKVALIVLGTAMQTYGEKLTDEQEVLSYAADILIDTYAAESAVLRARRRPSTRGTRRPRCTRPPPALVRQRRRAARGGRGAQCARGDGRRRHAAHAARRAAPRPEGDAGQHRRAAPAARRRGRRGGAGISCSL